MKQNVMRIITSYKAEGATEIPRNFPIYVTFTLCISLTKGMGSKSRTVMVKAYV